MSIIILEFNNIFDNINNNENLENNMREYKEKLRSFQYKNYKALINFSYSKYKKAIRKLLHIMEIRKYGILKNSNSMDLLKNFYELHRNFSNHIYELLK